LCSAAEGTDGVVVGLLNSHTGDHAVNGIQASINTPKRKRTPAVNRVSSIQEVSQSNLVKETDHVLIIELLVQDLQAK
jgi:hypothetical protein